MSTKQGIQFLFDSEYEQMGKSEEELGVAQPPLELPLPSSLTVIDLPQIDPLSLPQAGLWEMMQQRRTLRRYQESPLTLAELNIMLWFTQGVKRVTDRPVTMRTVPSGGARHPFETYLVVSNVDGLEPGLYRYMAINHQLAFLRKSDQIATELSPAIPNQNHIRQCPVSFWWATVADRATWRYNTRGYRYMMMDAGHVCENLYLAAEGLECGICAIGAFNDQAINQFFQLDGKDQFIIYGATVGKREIS